MDVHLKGYLRHEEHHDGLPEDWFTNQLKGYKSKNDVRISYVAQELETLKAFYYGELSIEDAAFAITRPISTTPVPDVKADFPELSGVVQLWEQITDALLEWPSDRIPGLIALLVAVSRIPDKLHRGEAVDEGDKSLLDWKCLPYLGMVWSDRNWLAPGDLVRRCPDAATRSRALKSWMRRQDVEARIRGAGFFSTHLPFRELVRWLEAESVVYGVEMPEAGVSGWSIHPDFHIPAIHAWIKHNGEEMYDVMRKDELKDMRVPYMTKQFDKPTDRWFFWMTRILEIADDCPDDSVKLEAQETVSYMEAIVSSSIKEEDL